MKDQEESNEGDFGIVEEVLHGLRELGNIHKFKKKKQGSKANVQDGSIIRSKAP